MSHCIELLYCVTLYWITVLCHTVLRVTVLCHTVLSHCIVAHSVVSRCILSQCIVWNCIVAHCFFSGCILIFYVSHAVPTFEDLGRRLQKARRTSVPSYSQFWRAGQPPTPPPSLENGLVYWWHRPYWYIDLFVFGLVHRWEILRRMFCFLSMADKAILIYFYLFGRIPITLRFYVVAKSEDWRSINWFNNNQGV